MQLYIVFEDLSIANVFLILHLVVVTRGVDLIHFHISYYLYNMQYEKCCTKQIFFALAYDQNVWHTVELTVSYHKYLKHSSIHAACCFTYCLLIMYIKKRSQIEAEITSMSLSSSEDRVFSSSESKRQQLKFSRCSSVSYTVFTALVSGSHVFVYPLFQVTNE